MQYPFNTQIQLGHVFSASECREAYGVRAACCRFRTVLKFPSSLDWRKRQQAARTPYASRHSDALNTYSLGGGEGAGERGPLLVRSGPVGGTVKMRSRSPHREGCTRR